MDFGHEAVIRTGGLILVLSVMLLGCGTPHPDQEYVALRLHSKWEFNGDIRSIEVVDETSDHDTEYTVEITTRNNRTVLTRFKYSGGRLYVVGLDASLMGYSEIRFDPPIPLLPSTSKIGEMERWDAEEIREGNPSRSFRIRVQTTVLKPFPVVCAGDTLNDIFRIRVDYAYQEPSVSPFLAGESEWWFAREVGIVRYQLGSRPYEDVILFDIP